MGIYEAKGIQSVHRRLLALHAVHYHCQYITLLFTSHAECPSSGLFAGAATEAATCPQEFTGGVRTSSSNGFACYSGLTADSTAVFMCDACGAECTGVSVCEAVCVCPSGQTEGQWSSSFENAACVVRGTNLASTCTHVIHAVILQTTTTITYELQKSCFQHECIMLAL